MRRGFEGQIFYGVKGTTAATLIENRVDFTTDTDPQMAPTTVAGLTTSTPLESEDVVAIKFSATLNMLNKESDAVLQALRTAANTGNQVALRTKDYASGKGFDGDVNVKESYGAPLNGQQTVNFTLTPNNRLREPQFYV
jgi:hypothetical protein